MRELLVIMCVLLAFFNVKSELCNKNSDSRRLLLYTEIFTNYELHFIIFKPNKVDRFVFLGDINYRNHIDFRDSYSICGQHFLEQASKYTELRMIRGNHENNTT